MQTVYEFIAKKGAQILLISRQKKATAFFLKYVHNIHKFGGQKRCTTFIDLTVGNLLTQIDYNIQFADEKICSC